MSSKAKQRLAAESLGTGARGGALSATRDPVLSKPASRPQQGVRSGAPCVSPAASGLCPVQVASRGEGLDEVPLHQSWAQPGPVPGPGISEQPQPLASGTQSPGPRAGTRLSRPLCCRKQSSRCAGVRGGRWNRTRGSQAVAGSVLCTIQHRRRRQWLGARACPCLQTPGRASPRPQRNGPTRAL